MSRRLAQFPVMVGIYFIIIIPLLITTASGYEITQSLYSWYHAEQACLATFGTHLASIHSTEDYNAAHTKCSELSDRCWIGLNDIHSEGTWRWADGSITDFGFNNNNSSSPTARISPWGGNEPNDLNGEDCVHVRPDARWNDRACDTEYHAICNQPTPDRCECYETVLVSEISYSGIERCYTYSFNSAAGCDENGVDWIVFGHSGCTSTDASSVIKSTIPSTLGITPSFNGRGSGTRGIKIGPFGGFNMFTICFDESQVFGTIHDGQIGYKRGDETYSCSVTDTTPDLCAATSSVVGSFDFDTHNEEPMVMVYVWSGLSAAFVSIMVVLIAYFWFIKSRDECDDKSSN